jgi:branched-chain amino acid aminotransferase
VDNRVIGSGGRGPLTKQLQTLYFDVVHGRVDKYSKWLTLV